MRPLYKYPHGQPTKRGWLFMGRHGGPCDKECRMCYYAYQDNLVFFHPDTLYHHANRMRHLYGLEACDISGGEATIYGPAVGARRPALEELVNHCAKIGLKPTIITHGQNNKPDLVKGVEAAGLEDWLISLHGLEGGHDSIVVDHSGRGGGGWKRLTDNLKNCERPVRFNTTAQEGNYRELPYLARFLADNQPATVWNIIQFNPFFAWQGKQEINFQVSMTDLAPLIAEAVHMAESAGWEVNVRYFPFCVAQAHGFARNCVNFYQTQVDPWEWCLVNTERIPMARVKAAGSLEAARRQHVDRIARARTNPVCSGCRFHPICEGPAEQYQKRYGLEELRPFSGEPVTDLMFFEHEKEIA